VRALVTGGAGFIGSELVRRLVDRGDTVVAVDNLANGRRENLAHVLGTSCELVIADIRDGEAMAALMRSAEVVFHLACLGVRHSLHSPQENHEVNATATLQLVTLARELNLERFVYVSSSEVYGTAARVPLSENDAKLPTTVYGASKLAGECYVRAFYTTYGFPSVIVRPFNTYGPRCHHEGDSGEVIPKFMLRSMVGRPLVIFGDGTQTRDFSYVSDTALGILLAGTHEDAIGQTFNLGTGQEISILDLAHLISHFVSQSDPRLLFDPARPGDIWRLCADSARAREVLGYEPRVSLRAGISELLRWYVGQGLPPENLLEDEIERNWLLMQGPARV
jgi:UDP-glucose 4-epimerase